MVITEYRCRQCEAKFFDQSVQHEAPNASVLTCPQCNNTDIEVSAMNNHLPEGLLSYFTALGDSELFAKKRGIRGGG